MRQPRRAQRRPGLVRVWIIDPYQMRFLSRIPGCGTVVNAHLAKHNGRADQVRALAGVIRFELQ
jgi:hypothetical protein